MKSYISEIFSSFQGEGGTVRGSCQGKRQIFIRFAGCNLAEARRPCVWCDTPQALDMKAKEFRVEKEPGSMDFETLPNPVDVDEVLKLIKGLETPDLHSLALTGGEPLCQPGFLEELCVETQHAIYLETNGTLPKAASRIAGHVDLACVDIKDETAIPYSGWEDMVDKEMKTIELLKDAGAQVFGKVVVTSSTESGNISWYAKELKDLEVPLAIQPVTTEDEKERITQKKLFRLTEAAAQYLSADEITLSFQTHKFYGIL